MVSDAVLPLRGFLICLKCGKPLTGSKSKGHGGVYHYYHCYLGCKCRFRAEKLNELFLQELRKYRPSPAFFLLYKRVLSDYFQNIAGYHQKEKKLILDQINQIESNLAHSRMLLSTQKIEAEDYYSIKKECNAQQEKLEAQITSLPTETKNIDDLLEQGIGNLMCIDQLFEKGTIEQQRQVIGSMYPEKLSFDGFLVRTFRVNDAASLIYSLGAGFEGNKKGQSEEISTLSYQVTPSGFKPETF